METFKDVALSMGHEARREANAWINDNRIDIDERKKRYNANMHYAGLMYAYSRGLS